MITGRQRSTDDGLEMEKRSDPNQYFWLMANERLINANGGMAIR